MQIKSLIYKNFDKNMQSDDLTIDKKILNYMQIKTLLCSTPVFHYDDDTLINSTPIYIFLDPIEASYSIKLLHLFFIFV
jgi:hypothetical protein